MTIGLDDGGPVRRNSAPRRTLAEQQGPGCSAAGAAEFPELSSRLQGLARRPSAGEAFAVIYCYGSRRLFGSSSSSARQSSRGLLAEPEPEPEPEPELEPELVVVNVSPARRPPHLHLLVTAPSAAPENQSAVWSQI